MTTPFWKLTSLAPGLPSCLSGQSFQPLSPVFPLLLSFYINPDAPRELFKNTPSPGPTLRSRHFKPVIPVCSICDTLPWWHPACFSPHTLFPELRYQPHAGDSQVHVHPCPPLPILGSHPSHVHCQKWIFFSLWYTFVLISVTRFAPLPFRSLCTLSRPASLFS